MPQLIKEIDGQWQSASDDGAEWLDLEHWHSGSPLRLSVDDEPTAEHAAASCIAIEFPAFNDGRGLSAAVLLRTRFGYAGDIRAVGAVHEDILHYMVRCGFTSAELPDDRDVATALACIRPYSDFYQQSVAEPEPQFKRVKRGESAQ
jgi:uncharacterized protein (DUF934 family)